MKRNPVIANAVVSVGYDAELKVLEVEFRDPNIGIYQFREVSVSLYEFLFAGDSFNEKYFIENIQGKFLTQRVS